jgi:hypothetical protein
MAEEEPEDMDRLTVLLQEQEDEENREKNFHCDFTSPDDNKGQSKLVTAQGIKKPKDLAQFNDNAIEEIFQVDLDTATNAAIAAAASITILKKARLKGLAQWIRNKSDLGDPYFTLGAATTFDIEEILRATASGKTESNREGTLRTQACTAKVFERTSEDVDHYTSTC